MDKQLSCINCRSKVFVKNGRHSGIQRHKCKDCGKTFRGVAKPPKYSPEFKLDAIKMYLSSMSIRAIGRIKGVHNSVISYWIKKLGLVTRDCFSDKLSNIQEKDIKIIELDELFTYVKKKKGKHTYLVLLTETGLELLILR